MDTLTRNKDLKTRIRFSTSLNKELSLQLETLSKETRIPKSKLLDEAIELLLLKHKEKSSSL
ncbi:ribbon-helix-helix domain-containing protein [Clostridium sp.]|uniref:ribbon-helix-helix domain-containing protein n=1 Tax=Clostridium sp. TaxID=1506 RepID=UPI0039942234